MILPMVIENESNLHCSKEPIAILLHLFNDRNKYDGLDLWKFNPKTYRTIGGIAQREKGKAMSRKCYIHKNTHTQQTAISWVFAKIRSEIKHRRKSLSRIQLILYRIDIFILQLHLSFLFKCRNFFSSMFNFLCILFICYFVEFGAWVFD